jgi:PhoPQ-activated pathogenicity-related protein
MEKATKSLRGRDSKKSKTLAVMIALTTCAVSAAFAGALEDYVQQPDDSYSWKQSGHLDKGGFTVYHLEMQSQTWRGHPWTHHIQVVRPSEVRHPGKTFLFVTGDGDGTGHIDMLSQIAKRAGIIAAVVTRVPNQPLYDGRREDALLAFTLDRYLRTGDKTWPLLFPMVKSAVRAMDAVAEFGKHEFGQRIGDFIVSGASKRGWTTWLTAAADPRVEAIAPIVFDMLNMKAQTQWAARMYGKQSRKISDYTERKLVERIDDPRAVELRRWIDPYSYRASANYKLPKLLLLGANDPYWVVDSLRHYWDQLPEPKLVYETPNAGHGLGGGKEARQTLAAFVQMIADGESLPDLKWSFSDKGKAGISVIVDRKVEGMRLWTAESEDRDFRDERWTSKELEVRRGSSKAAVSIATPDSGYRAYLVEVLLRSSTGQEYKLSTEARVTPDGLRK